MPEQEQRSFPGNKKLIAAWLLVFLASLVLTSLYPTVVGMPSWPLRFVVWFVAVTHIVIRSSSEHRAKEAVVGYGCLLFFLVAELI